jgi:hypothetical protein
MRTKQRLAIATVVALAVGLLAFGSMAGANRLSFSIPLSSAVEVPTPNDTATGTADITINPGLREVCYDITWDDVAGTVTASHIHIAPVGVAGPVVVPLFTTPQTSDANGDGSASDCITSTATSAQLAQVIAKPAEYYVNVHSTQNMPGAIRGQLGS